MSNQDRRTPEEARQDLAAAQRLRRAAVPTYPRWYPALTSVLTAGTFTAFAVGRAIDDGVGWAGTAAYAVAVALGLVSVTVTGRTEGRRGVVALPRRSRPRLHTTAAFAAAGAVALLAAIPFGLPGFLAAGGVALGLVNWWSLSGTADAGTEA
jgi:hypothetical protein